MNKVPTFLLTIGMILIISFVNYLLVIGLREIIDPYFFFIFLLFFELIMGYKMSRVNVLTRTKWEILIGNGLLGSAIILLSAIIFLAAGLLIKW